MYHFLQTSLSPTCTRQYSVYGEPSGHGFESLLQPETFSSTFFGTVRLFQFFSALCDFFWNFFVAKGPPFKFFDILQQIEVSKSPKGSPFLVFRHYETVSKISFFVFFRKFFQKIVKLNFLNVSKGSPSTFLIFCNRLDFQKVERVPL